jgi:hypothetical protein
VVFLLVFALLSPNSTAASRPNEFIPLSAHTVSECPNRQQ